MPKLSYLYFENGFDDSTLSHNPIVIRKNTQGPGETTSGNPGENCCDQIQIVYEDFNQNHYELNQQPFKRYRITYFAQLIQQLKLLEFINVLKVTVSQELIVHFLILMTQAPLKVLG